jgi:preprotein translocase subunit YajC
MVRDLRVGDEVVTAGGIYGEVTRLDEDEVAVEIAPQLEVRVARRAIAAVLKEPEEAEDPAESEAETEEPARDASGDENAG